MKKNNTGIYAAGFLLVVAMLFAVAIITQQSGDGITGLALADIEDNQGVVVGHKITDDPEFETRFVAVERTNSALKVRFYHDSEFPQPVWIEGDVVHTFSVLNGIADPLDVVTLTVLIEGGNVPDFKLHIGAESEVFEFGTSSGSGGPLFSSQEVISGCAVVNTSTTLTADITASGECIRTNASNIYINCSGFSINGNFAGGRGINVSQASGVTIHDCFIENFTVNLYFFQVNDSLVYNVTTGNDTQGTTTADQGGVRVAESRYNTFENNSFRSNGTFGWLFFQSSNNNLTNNNATGRTDAIRIDSTTGTFAENNTLDGNNATANLAAFTGRGINLDASTGSGVRNNTLINNTASGFQDGIILATDTTFMTLIDNLGIGPVASATGIDISGTDHVVIRNNGTALSTGVGIQSGGRPLIFANNSGQSASSGDGIDITSAGFYIDNLGVSAASGNGIEIASLGSNVNFTQNRGFSSTGDGIEISSVPSNVNFTYNEGNQSSGTSGSGIFVQGSGRLIVGSNGSSNAGNGIRVTGANNMLIDSKGITITGDSGIEITAASNNITNSTASTLSGTAISDTAAGVRIIDTQVFSNTTGVSLSSSANTYVFINNEVFANGTGLLINAVDRGNHTGNTFAGSNSGVAIIGTSLTHNHSFTDFNLFENCSTGILLNTSNVMDNTIENNTFRKNTIGINIERVGKGNLIRNNTFNNGTRGSRVNGFNNTFLINKYSLQFEGILLANNNTIDTLVANNTFENTSFGVRILSSAKINTIINNTFFNNTKGSDISSAQNNTFLENLYLSNSFGISISALSQDNKIENNTLQNNTIGVDIVTASTLNEIKNNTFFNNSRGSRAVNGSNNTHSSNLFLSNIIGTLLTGSARDNLFENNTYQDNTESGVKIEPSATSNTLRSNTFTSNQWGVLLTGGTENIISNSTISGTRASVNVTAIGTDTGFNNTFANTTLVANSTFERQNSTHGPTILTYISDIGITAQRTLIDIMSVSFNRIFVNSTTASEFNTSASIRFTNLLLVPQPLVDREDDNTFASCSAGDCTISEQSSGILRFNVSRFTVYSSNESGAILCPVAPNSNITTAANATHNGTNTINISNSTNGDGLGFSLFAGDINNDTVKDIITGAPFTYFNSSVRNAGRVYVLYGVNPFIPSRNVVRDANITINGESLDALLGHAVGSGDVNNDSIDDLIVGSPGNKTVGILFGANNLGNVNITLSQLNVTINVSSIDDLSIAIGDLNGDNLSDIAIGQVDYENDSTTSPGRVDVVFGRENWPLQVNLSFDSNATFNGTFPRDFFGYAVSIGDINADTFQDLIIGSPGRNISNVENVGIGYAFFGGSSFSSAALSSANVTFEGESAVSGINNTFALTTFSLFAHADVNNDTIRDVLIGAPRSNAPPDKEDAGAVHVVFGSSGLSGTISLSDANVTLYGSFGNSLGVPPGERAGFSVFARDVNGDFVDDIFVGAPRAHSNGFLDAGIVYQAFGRPSWPRFINLSSSNQTLCGQKAGDYLGFSLGNGSVTTSTTTVSSSTSTSSTSSTTTSSSTSTSTTVTTTTIASTTTTTATTTTTTTTMGSGEMDIALGFTASAGISAAVLDFYEPVSTPTTTTTTTTTTSTSPPPTTGGGGGSCITDWTCSPPDECGGTAVEGKPGFCKHRDHPGHSSCPDRRHEWSDCDAAEDLLSSDSQVGSGFSQDLVNQCCKSEPECPSDYPEETPGTCSGEQQSSGNCQEVGEPGESYKCCCKKECEVQMRCENEGTDKAKIIIEEVPESDCRGKISEFGCDDVPSESAHLGISTQEMKDKQKECCYTYPECGNKKVEAGEDCDPPGDPCSKDTWSLFGIFPVLSNCDNTCKCPCPLEPFSRNKKFCGVDDTGEFPAVLSQDTDYKVIKEDDKCEYDEVLQNAKIVDICKHTQEPKNQCWVLPTPWCQDAECKDINNFQYRGKEECKPAAPSALVPFQEYYAQEGCEARIAFTEPPAAGPDNDLLFKFGGTCYEVSPDTGGYCEPSCLLCPDTFPVTIFQGLTPLGISVGPVGGPYLPLNLFKNFLKCKCKIDPTADECPCPEPFVGEYPDCKCPEEKFYSGPPTLLDEARKISWAEKGVDIEEAESSYGTNLFTGAAVATYELPSPTNCPGGSAAYPLVQQSPCPYGVPYPIGSPQYFGWYCCPNMIAPTQPTCPAEYPNMHVGPCDGGVLLGSGDPGYTFGWPHPANCPGGSAAYPLVQGAVCPGGVPYPSTPTGQHNGWWCCPGSGVASAEQTWCCPGEPELCTDCPLNVGIDGCPCPPPLTGTYPDCGCPEGTTGTLPDCVCPEDVYVPGCPCPEGSPGPPPTCCPPDAIGPAPTCCVPGDTREECQCPEPLIGTLPDCSCPPDAIGPEPDCCMPGDEREECQCPAPQVGILPDCSCPPEAIGPMPDCCIQNDPRPECYECPEGTYGTPPECIPCPPDSDEPQCQVCPPGTYGTPPDCEPCLPDSTDPACLPPPPCEVTGDCPPECIDPICEYPVCIGLGCTTTTPITPNPVDQLTQDIQTLTDQSIYCANALSAAKIPIRLPIIANDGSSANEISLVNGKIELMLQNRSGNASANERVYTWNTPERLAPGEWYYVSVTYMNNGSQLMDANIYIDGIKQNLTTTGAGYSERFIPRYNPAGNYTIGRSLENLGLFYIGRIDEVELYHRVLNESEINILYTADLFDSCGPECRELRSELTSKWPANMTANDSVYINHGNMTGGANFSAGKLAEAFNLDGFNDYVKLNNSLYNPFPATGFTYNFWVNSPYIPVGVKLENTTVGPEVVPEGYEVVSATKVTCDGQTLDITVNVPDNYVDLSAFMLYPDEEKPLDSDVLDTAQCGESWLADLRRRQFIDWKPSTLAIDELDAIESVQAIIEPTDADKLVRSGEYQVEIYPSEAVQESITVTLSSPKTAVPELAHPNIVIVGMPLVVELSAGYSGGAMIRMPFAAPDFVDPESLVIYVRIGEQWRSLETTINTAENYVEAIVDDILPFIRNDQAMFAVMGVTCANCNVVEIVKVHDGGSRKAVFLVHGFTADRLRWQPFIDDLRQTHSDWQVWTVGYPLNLDGEQVTRELASLLEQNVAEYDEISFMTHSIGGIIVQKSLELGRENRYSWPAITQDVIMAGQPGLGSPSGEVYGRLYASLLNVKSAAQVWNPRAHLLREAVEGIQVLRAPNVEYFVVAGRQPYPFTKDLFERPTGELIPNDGILSIFSARTVGGDEITDACEHYFEIPRTHTDLVDDWLPRKVMQRVLLREDAEDNPDKALAGYNKFVKVTETNCKSGTLVVTGKPISEEAAAAPLNCNCGNGVCGEGENAINCPTDCAAKFGYLFLCRIAPWFLYPLLFILLVVSAAYAYKSIKRHKRTKTGKALLLATGVLTVLFILMNILCRTTSLIAYLVLSFNAAMLLFTQLHLEFRGMKHKPIHFTLPKNLIKLFTPSKKPKTFKPVYKPKPEKKHKLIAFKPKKESVEITFDNKSVKKLERTIKKLLKE